jgi:type IV pilus assembly protein PilQ
MRNNGLTKELDGNVLRIATRDTMRKEAEDRQALAKAETDAIPTETTTRVLSYAKASDVSTTLRRFLSPRGDIFFDERSNTMIIRDIPASLPPLDNLIRQLDRKAQQVEIEARVVLASRNFARDIGTQFGFSTTSTGGRSVYGGADSVGETPVVGRPIPPPLVGGGGSMPLMSNFPAVGPTSGLTFAHASPNFALDYLITAAESRGVGKLLSSPQLVAQNNAKATVMQGTKIPIQTNVNNTIAIQYVNAVLQLVVTPQITADGTVYMEVLVENTSIDPGIDRVQGIPALATQSAETKTTIADGGTVVIGGVIISNQRTDVQQVPLVGSVPLIGHLFKRTSVSVSSQELLFFITPRILPG